MTAEKLIDDAVQAFEDREITAPSREHLRVALDAFDASLTKCGCGACTTARREHIALTDHDRTTLARALHGIVYSPGANYDRAVPGIQEHMLACAEKVAAALPWIAPHTPTDDEREALAQWLHLRFGKNQTLDWDALSDRFKTAWRDLAGDAPLGRSEVSEPSAEEEIDPEICKGCDEYDPLALCMAANPEPQGEPSDAQLLAQGFRDGVNYIDDQPGPWGAAVVAGRAEAARRVAAAGGVR